MNYTSLGQWESEARKKGYLITKDNKKGTYHAWVRLPNGQKHVGEYVTHSSAGKEGGRLDTSYQNAQEQMVEVVGGKKVRTADNPLNTWVRSLDDGKMYRTLVGKGKVQNSSFQNGQEKARVEIQNKLDAAGMKLENAYSESSLKEQLKSAEKELADAQKRKDKGDIDFFTQAIKEIKNQLSDERFKIEKRRSAWAGK